MKYLIKRFWYILLMALVINIPLVVLGTVRTDKNVMLKGDTTLVKDFVEIENANLASGTFSTIYVISFDHSTLLQNIMLKNDITSEVSNISEGYLHLSDFELGQMGQIQHQSSIMYSIILAYNEAQKIDNSINIDYQFANIKVSYYTKDSSFRIGDEIVGMNGIMAENNFEQFREEFNNRENGDIYNVIRNGKAIEIENNENELFGGYQFYTINLENTTPKFSIKNSNVGGPSGGLLQTLALYNSLIKDDITKGYDIAGTGTISYDGTVGEIGGIKQKIYTAFDDNMDIFLCPEENYEEALEAYNTLKNKEKMRLYKVSTFSEALEVLKNA